MKPKCIRISKYFLLLCLSLFTLLQGCSSKGSNPYVPTPQDCEPGNLPPFYVYSGIGPLNIYEFGANRAIMKSDRGFYYNAFKSKNGTPLCMHYVDKATGKDVLLCNKPECKHDGNEYCAATNSNYMPLAYQLYDGDVYASTMSFNAGKFTVKLIRITPDGASLSEVATVYETFSDRISITPSKQGLLIHRNIAIIPFCFQTDDMKENEQAFGTAILNLTTKEITFADPEPAAIGNYPWMNVSARGDHFYYVTREDKKYLLHRMKVSDLSRETFELETRFGGDYVVLSDDRIVYARKSGALLCTYDPADGSKSELTPKTTISYVPDIAYNAQGAVISVNSYELRQIDPTPYHITDLFTDGTFIYLQNMPQIISVGEVDYGPDAYCILHVLNADLEEIHHIIVPDPQSLLQTDLTKESSHYAKFVSFHFIGEDVYMAYSIADEYHLFSCSREDFLNGTPHFQHVYDQER